MADKFYAVAAEGEPIPSADEWHVSIEDAQSAGEEEVINSCAGLPSFVIWEINAKLLYTSEINVEWNREY